MENWGGFSLLAFWLRLVVEPFLCIFAPRSAYLLMHRLMLLRIVAVRVVIGVSLIWWWSLGLLIRGLQLRRLLLNQGLFLQVNLLWVARELIISVGPLLLALLRRRFRRVGLLASWNTAGNTGRALDQERCLSEVVYQCGWMRADIVIALPVLLDWIRRVRMTLSLASV